MWAEQQLYSVTVPVTSAVCADFWHWHSPYYNMHDRMASTLSIHTSILLVHDPSLLGPVCPSSMIVWILFLKFCNWYETTPRPIVRRYVSVLDESIKHEYVIPHPKQLGLC